MACRIGRASCGWIFTGRIAPATPHALYQDQALYAPDGSRVAYLYTRGGDPMNQADAMVVSANGSGDRDATLALDRHVSTASWMPDSKTLLLSVYDSATVPLYLQPLHGTARRLPLGGVTQASIEPQGSVARDGTIVFTGSRRTHPDEVYLLPPGAAAPQRITHYNDAIAHLDLGRPVRLVWRGPGGRLEDGVLTYPPGYIRGKKYPLVLRIHGGPTESSTIAFEPFYQPRREPWVFGSRQTIAAATIWGTPTSMQFSTMQAPAPAKTLWPAYARSNGWGSWTGGASAFRGGRTAVN